MVTREWVGDFGRRLRAISNALLFGGCSHALVRFLPPAKLLFFLRLLDGITAVDFFLRNARRRAVISLFASIIVLISQSLQDVRAWNVPMTFEMFPNGNISETTPQYFSAFNKR